MYWFLLDDDYLVREDERGYFRKWYIYGEEVEILYKLFFLIICIWW